MASAVLGAAGALPALAQACTPSTAPIGQPFQQFGDTNNYQLAPAGAFEQGATGWSLNKASVVTGNEIWKVHSAYDSHSLSIASGGYAISPPICASDNTPTFRFFARAAAAGGTFITYVLWTDSSGVQHSSAIASFAVANTAWVPIVSLSLHSSLPLWEAGNTLTVRLKFVPLNSVSWSIDDLYIDPYSRA